MYQPDTLYCDVQRSTGDAKLPYAAKQLSHLNLVTTSVSTACRQLKFQTFILSCESPPDDSHHEGPEGHRFHYPRLLLSRLLLWRRDQERLHHLRFGSAQPCLATLQNLIMLTTPTADGAPLDGVTEYSCAVYYFSRLTWSDPKHQMTQWPDSFFSVPYNIFQI